VVKGNVTKKALHKAMELFHELTLPIPDDTKQFPVLPAIPIAYDLDPPSENSVVQQSRAKFFYDCENRILFLVRSVAGDLHDTVVGEALGQVRDWIERSSLCDYIVPCAGGGPSDGVQPDVSLRAVNGFGNGDQDLYGNTHPTPHKRFIIEVEVHHRGASATVEHVQLLFDINPYLCDVVVIKLYEKRSDGLNRAAVAIQWTRDPDPSTFADIIQTNALNRMEMIDFGTVPIDDMALEAWNRALQLEVGVNPFARVSPVPTLSNTGKLNSPPATSGGPNWTISIHISHLLNGVRSVDADSSSPLLLSTMNNPPPTFQLNLFRILKKVFAC
jgi:hypothetical protein